jgi:NADH:ubiquinone oxidoreductase subunit 3 (subunit A)
MICASDSGQAKIEQEKNANVKRSTEYLMVCILRMVFDVTDGDKVICFALVSIISD